ncbi:G-type lectin S-receptor-like serine/threonine-protein kinase B120 [Zingiber officinale]|uniref:G-type lectin S-receptor-like serine/threonine-protein kinase B120 n=1 Tax=Zingiber officinale TaxID=94328 RepID=UPI001C4B8E60|nr:G-type lectin S-receptor-like serine/threonine-protein kinase B120 [Zingiber officinale]
MPLSCLSPWDWPEVPTVFVALKPRHRPKLSVHFLYPGLAPRQPSSVLEERNDTMGLGVSADATDTNRKRYLLIFDEREWSSFLSLPRDDCDNYNSCGNNSVCTKGYYSISCRCLEGFVEIGSVVGCKRREPFRCSSNQFRKEPSVKVLDTENATSRGKISLESCNKLCLDDCSCVAYAVINGPYGCITWRGDLLDLRSFPDGGDDLYIRLQGVLVRRWRNRASTCRLQLRFPNVEKGSISALDVLPSYDLHTIKIATNDFSKENKLGEGGFGAVYKGQLDDGQKIAVKKLSRYSSQGPNEFLNELSVIAKLQHTNLVRLLGYCIEGDERIMILEYMENKSLDAFIYGQHIFSRFLILLPSQMVKN